MIIVGGLILLGVILGAEAIFWIQDLAPRLWMGFFSILCFLVAVDNLNHR